MSKDDDSLKSCMEGRECLHAKGVEDIYFNMHMGVITNLALGIPFTTFEVNILKVTSIPPSQLHPNI